MCLPSQTNFDDKKFNFRQIPKKNSSIPKSLSINSNIATKSKESPQKSGTMESKLSLGNTSNKNKLLQYKIPMPTRTSLYYSTEDSPDLRVDSFGSKAQENNTNSLHTPSPHYRSRKSISIASDFGKNEAVEVPGFFDSNWQQPARMDPKVADFSIIDTEQTDKD